MTTKRFIALGLLATSAMAGLVVAIPASRHAVRRVIASHTHVPFSTTTETPVVPVVAPMPAVAARDPDLRFIPRGLATAPVGSLVAPRLDASAFAQPTATIKPLLASATVPTTEFDKTTAEMPATPPADASVEVDLAGARQAMRHYHDGDLPGGDEFAQLTTGDVRIALDWAAIRLDSHGSGAERLKAFATAHPTWPLRPWVDRRLEEARLAGKDPAAILAMFATATPSTFAGTLALARAKIASGDLAGGAALVQAEWQSDDLSAPEEAEILRDFGSVLRHEDHKRRADRLLYKESVPAALRAAALAGPDVTLLARARAAVIASTPADMPIAAVPKPLQADPGLLFSRIQQARRANHIDVAAALLQSAPSDDAALVDGDAWWVERRLVARKLLDAGNPKLAYAIAAGEKAESDTARIDGEFHAGWIALRFLDDPALAAPHFTAVSRLSATPISVARGAYWQGRTAEAQGDAEAAAGFYAAAAALPTTFYGQIAAAKLGRGPLVLRQPEAAATGMARNDAIRAVAALFTLGERDLAVSLAIAEAKVDPDEAQVAALAAVVEETRDARATLVVAKAGAQRGMPIDEAAFPTFGIPGYEPIDHSADRATVLAIARQESEFDPRAVSSAGAMGLMQLIASTAKKTAEDAGIGFDETRLLTDASFNARIGAAHLGKLLGDLDGSYILTFAAYNAGPRRVKEWIAAYGDPRKPGVDPIDWIERIPFTETRNYVQRVFENMQIYRAQFGMPTALLTPPQPGSPGKGT